VVGDPPAAATIAATPGEAYAGCVGQVAENGTANSERLARRCFSLLARGEAEQIAELMHPEVEIVTTFLRPGEVLRGRDAVLGFVERARGHFYEPHTDVFRPVDEDRIVVEGRIRWLDDDRILRDNPVIWAMEFRDGLLFRSAPAQSVLEAEALLAVTTRENGE
jgi:ketosteroid isomerase-like protein